MDVGDGVGVGVGAAPGEDDPPLHAATMADDDSIASALRRETGKTEGNWRWLMTALAPCSRRRRRALFTHERLSPPRHVPQTLREPDYPLIARTFSNDCDNRNCPCESSTPAASKIWTLKAQANPRNLFASKWRYPAAKPVVVLDATAIATPSDAGFRPARSIGSFVRRSHLPRRAHPCGGPARSSVIEWRARVHVRQPSR